MRSGNAPSWKQKLPETLAEDETEAARKGWLVTGSRMCGMDEDSLGKEVEKGMPSC